MHLANVWSTLPEKWGMTWLLVMPYGLFLNSCSTKDQALQQYFVRGEELYAKHCSNCHQMDGKGLGLLYPPVDKSDFMDSDFAQVICLMEYGKRGALVVNGKSFNQPMPGIPSLTDQEIAQIATYLYNNWDRQKGLIDENQVTGVLKQCR